MPHTQPPGTPPTSPNPACTRAGFVAVIGAPNAGKSTLLNQILGQKIAIVTPKVQTTRVNMRGIYTHAETATQMVFVDTPGIHKPRRLLDKAMVHEAHKAWTEADAVLLLVDTLKGFNAEFHMIMSNLEPLNKPLLLVFNKVDKINKEKLLPLMQQAGEMGKFTDIFAISAQKGGAAVQQLLQRLSSYMPESPYLYDPDDVTDTSMRTIAAEITREKAFMLLQQELPYSVAVETVTFEEFNNGDIKIHQNILLERESQKRIVVGQGGAMLKAIGEKARQAMSQSFACPVHLFLKVKVKEKWSEDPAVMKSFGLEAPKDKS